MNPPIWPPLLDGTYLVLTVVIAAEVMVAASYTSEQEARSILGSAADRYGAISDDEFGPALESAGKKRFYTAAGVFVVVLCAVVWRLLLFYGALMARYGKAHEWPTWASFLLVVPAAMAIPFLLRWCSRWLIRRRLDRKFADRVAT